MQNVEKGEATARTRGTALLRSPATEVGITRSHFLDSAVRPGGGTPKLSALVGLHYTTENTDRQGPEGPVWRPGCGVVYCCAV